MDGVYTAGSLLRVGLMGLGVVLPVTLLAAGMLARPERRARVVLWSLAAYGMVWALWVLYHAAILARLAWKQMH